MSLERRIRELRLKNGQSLQKAADQMGISKAHLWELEAGKSSNPSIDLLRRVATHYEVRISWLMEEDEQEQSGAMFRDVERLDDDGRAFIQDVIDSHLKRMRGRGD